MKLALTFVVLTAVGAGCTVDEATITDPSSPYYDRPCPLEQHHRYKSDLIADCRCATNQSPSQGIPLCRRPYQVNLDGIAVGEGPTLAGVFNAEYLGGFLDEDEGPRGTLYIAAGFGASTENQGVVLKVDVATGDRTIVVDKSPRPDRPLGRVYDVRRAPGGKLYLYARDPFNIGAYIFEADPATGATTTRWTTNDLMPEFQTSGHCRIPQAPGIVQYTYTGFAVDPEGRVYLPFSNPTHGRGIVRLSADFTSCEVVTGNGIPEATRGDGPFLSGFIQGFTFHDGHLFAFSTQPKQFFAVDLATGDRTLIHEPSGPTATERWALWDAGRGVWWLTGMTNGVSIDAFDPATGDAINIFTGGVFPWMPLGAAGPVTINSLNYAPVWLTRDGNLLVAQDGFSVVEFEPSTGNSIILSL
ncbi:MAG TPA: hypothetical protein VM734_03115 [Kofleriaceae bacterium]|nr:hypothetical protein [Kofleriaceae bacterium]